jgi:hypothetical protein
MTAPTPSDARANTIAPYLGGSDQVAGRASRVGSVAPDFQLRDETGQLVTLRRLLRQRPLVLHFYRGAW